MRGSADTEPQKQAIEQILSTQNSAQLLLEAGEFESAIAVASRNLENGAQLQLVENWTILGDSHLALGQVQAAIQAYAQARFELRLQAGLHRSTEVPLLLREAEAFMQVNNLKRANDRHEYVFTIQTLQAGPTERGGFSVRATFPLGGGS